MRRKLLLLLQPDKQRLHNSQKTIINHVYELASMQMAVSQTNEATDFIEPTEPMNSE